MKEKLYQIKSNYFCAGIIVKNKTIIYTAPIIKWMKGKSIRFIKQYCRNKNFKIKRIRINENKKKK